jgi:hypothetical protein
MVYWVPLLLGATLGMFLLSRLTLWAFKRVSGDTGGRVVIAHAVALIVAVVAYAYASTARIGASPNFLGALALYAIPTALWVTVDLLGVRGRQAKASISN